MRHIILREEKFLPGRRCDLEIEVSAGDRILITGENGIGKTTLLDRLWKEFAGESVLVPQKSLDHFYERSVKKLKEVYLSAAGSSVDEILFDQLWKAFHLEPREKNLLSTLSGGEGQLLKLALGLAQKGQIHLLDEPSQYLDHGKKGLLHDVLKSWPQDRTLVIVEHDSFWLPKNFRNMELVVEQETLKKKGT